MQIQPKIIHQIKKFNGFIENINNTSLEMVYIPSGNFTMGAPVGEIYSSDDERPQHPVTLKSFFMGRYPITQAQWEAVANLPKERRELNPNPSHFPGNKRPVESISWYDAVEFCARLSRYTQKNYRLPTEAEWEYACRGGTRTPFHFGQTISTVIANYNGSDEQYGAYPPGERGEYRKQTTEVDYFQLANNFGLSDMHGNVWEWCGDTWHDNYEGAPPDGRVWSRNNDNLYNNYLDNLEQLLNTRSSHVLRGGSWNHNPGSCRCAYRIHFDSDVDTNNDVGFRVVCALPLL